MEKKGNSGSKTWAIVKRLARRWFIEALGAMALGLFSSLIIGLIISQFAKIPGLGMLKEFSDIVGAASPVVGAAIGVAIAWGLKCKPLVIFSSAATGAFGYSLGGPVGAYLAALAGAEIGGLVAGKTPVDIVLTPIVTILAGCLVGRFAGPPISGFMTWLGAVINQATMLQPFWMGIAVAVLVGLILTAPISSAALCIMLGLSGLAAGAATVGCCAQMVGFAVASFKDNRWGGLLAQGVGTSMLQVPNILRRPQILIPPTLAGAILGPIATGVFQMQNIPLGAGMGTSGLVGPIGAWTAMAGQYPPVQLILIIVVLCVIAPALLSGFFAWLLVRIRWIRPGDQKLMQL